MMATVPSPSGWEAAWRTAQATSSTASGNAGRSKVARVYRVLTVRYPFSLRKSARGSMIPGAPATQPPPWTSTTAGKGPSPSGTVTSASISETAVMPVEVAVGAEVVGGVDVVAAAGADVVVVGAPVVVASMPTEGAQAATARIRTARKPRIGPRAIPPLHHPHRFVRSGCCRIRNCPARPAPSALQ